MFQPPDLDVPLADLPRLGSLKGVMLDRGGEQISTVDLRRFLHRASRLLSPEGFAIWHDRDPEEAEVLGLWPGQNLSGGGQHRSLRQHFELLRLFPFAPMTPRRYRDDEERSRLLFVARHRVEGVGFSGSTTCGEDRKAVVENRYGTGADYRRFDRLFEPEIVDDLLYGFSKLRVRPNKRVLALGMNDGRELELLSEVGGEGAILHGLDLSESAVQEARLRFPEHAERMQVADLADLGRLGLPQFDAIIALNTLQCRTVDRDQVLRDIGPLLKDRGALLFSHPNCRHGARDLLRRPFDRKDPAHDRARVWKDMRFLIRYLHRGRFKDIEGFGTYDAFVFARR